MVADDLSDMISMNDFSAEPKFLREAMLDSMRRVLDSGWYVLGSEVAEFERRWSAECGTRHAVGVGNGMDAIEIILRGLDVGPGDEVITTPMTAFATVLAVLRAGAIPVLADITEETALLSPGDVFHVVPRRFCWCTCMGRCETWNSGKACAQTARFTL